MYEWVNEGMDELMDEAEKSSGTLRQKLLQIKINMEIKIQIQKRAGGFLRNPQGSWGPRYHPHHFLVSNIREGHHYGPFLLVVLEENDRSF